VDGSAIHRVEDFKYLGSFVRSVTLTSVAKLLVLSGLWQWKALDYHKVENPYYKKELIDQ
jgi:hypothetical protein